MDKNLEYQQIGEETLQEGFRISLEEAICENGMPENVRAHYESLADLNDSELLEKASSGALFQISR